MTTRGAHTRTRLLEATHAVVAEIGYARATTRAIADRAGVAEGTIYRHFPNKRSMLFAAALQGHQATMDYVSRLPQQAGRNSVRSNLHETLTMLLRLQDDILPLELAIRADPDLFRDRRLAFQDAMQDGTIPGPAQAIADYLRAEQGLGRVRPGLDVVHVAVAILASLAGLVLVMDQESSHTELDQALVAATVDVLVRGMSGEGPNS